MQLVILPDLGKLPESRPKIQEQKISTARQRLLLFGLPGVAFVLLAALFVLSKHLPSEGTSMAPAHPTIVLALGEEVSSVLKHSTFDFKKSEIMDEDMLWGSTPFVLEYGDAPVPLVFPPGRYFLARAVDGVIVDVNISPQFEVLGLDGAIVLCRELMTRLEAARWVRTHASGMPLDVVKQRLLEGLSDSGLDDVITVSAWHKDDSEAYLNLKRSGVEPRGAQQRAGYILTLSFENAPLSRYRADEVLRKRKTDSVPIEERRVIQRF